LPPRPACITSGAAALAEKLLRQADFQSGQRLCAGGGIELAAIVFGRAVEAGRIAFVEAGHAVEQERAVGCRAAQRAGLVE
jgi:hypothetical protein